MHYYEIDKLMLVPRAISGPARRRWAQIVTEIQRSRDPKTLLYHYTSYSAAVDIIRGDALYMFDPLTSNDEEELLHAKDFALEALKKEIPIRGRRSKQRRRFFEEIEDFLESFAADYFICCFSEGDDQLLGTANPGDRLDAWRAYGGDGNGVAFGFDWKQLECELKVMSPRHSLVEVVYKDEEKIERLKYLFQMANQVRLNYGIPYSAVTSMVCFGLAELMPAFKNKAFEGEKEWRAVILNLNQDRFNIENEKFNGIAKNFLKIPLACGEQGFASPLALREILVGPARNKRVLEQSIKQTLKFRKRFVPVSLSQLPYRAS